VAPTAALRDTDADWRELGEAQPYWGVLTQPDYRSENLTPERIEAFYATGRSDIEGLVTALEQATGARPAGRALDFGCGAGRLTEAMCAYAREVVGCDVSPGMLATARARGGRARYVEAPPAGPFDWINAFIVFQHIPPERGLGLIEDLLARLAPGGHVSLHVTVWREAELEPAVPGGWRGALPGWARRAPPPAPAGTMMMYDYDLSQVVKRFNRAGVGPLTLLPTDHGGHHGVIVLGRRTT
jgi:SAM-dependent methyltransferase